MSSITRKRPVVTLVVLIGLLAVAAPANAGIAVGNPPTQQGGAVVASRDATTPNVTTARDSSGLNEPRPNDTAQLLSADHNI